MKPELITTFYDLEQNEHGEYEVYYKDFAGNLQKQVCFTWLQATNFVFYFPNSEVHSRVINSKINEAQKEVEEMKTAIEYGLKMEAEALKQFGIKESEGKLIYDLDWKFIEGMATRMQQNKDRYPRGNWQKPLPPEELSDALTRHFIEIQKGNWDDGGQTLGHYYAIACNAMMAVYQIRERLDENELPF